MSEHPITRSEFNLLRSELKLEIVTLHNKLVSDLIDVALLTAGLIVFVILLVT